MTKKTWIVSMLAAAALSTGSVMADQTTTGSAPAAAAAPASPSTPKGHPCKALRTAAISACGTAGYVKGDHKTQKGLFDDCVKPIMEGKGAPANVSVDPGLVSACQAKRVFKQ